MIRMGRRWAPTSTIIVVALPGGSHDPVRAFQAGAGGYVIKDASMDWLPNMLIRHASDGTPPISPKVTEQLVADLDSPVLATQDDPSARELEVLQLVRDGFTNREIADALAVSISTVKTHVHNLLGKLGAANRTQLALEAPSELAEEGGRAERRRRNRSARG